MLQSMGLQRVGHYWATEEQQKLYKQYQICFPQWLTALSMQSLGPFILLQKALSIMCVYTVSQVAQWGRICLPMQQEMQMCTWPLGWEDLLEVEMATHCSILTWKIPWTEDPGRLQSKGSQRIRHDWAHTHVCIYKCVLLSSHSVVSNSL